MPVNIEEARATIFRDLIKESRALECGLMHYFVIDDVHAAKLCSTQTQTMVNAIIKTSFEMFVTMAKIELARSKIKPSNS